MKSKLTFLLFVSLTFHTYAQETETYKSFLHSGVVKWLYFMPADACGMNEFSAYGDTIINQLEYKIMWYSANYIFDQNESDINQKWLTGNILSSKSHMFIRQSDDSSKLYVYDSYRKEEYLVVDMTLKEGDEFYFPSIGTEIVESVKYENGLKTIYFKTNDNLYVQNLVFVESIGPNVDFWYLNTYTILSTSLVCYSRFSFLYNTSPYLCACLVNKTREVAKSELHYKLVDEIIEIQLNDLSSSYWEMYDYLGKVVRRAEFANESVLRISTTGLNRGLYLIRLYESGKDSSVTLKVLL